MGIADLLASAFGGGFITALSFVIAYSNRLTKVETKVKALETQIIGIAESLKVLPRVEQKLDDMCKQLSNGWKCSAHIELEKAVAGLKAKGEK